MAEAASGKPKGDSQYRDEQAQAVLPKEAATLVIVRQGSVPKVLMGKRAASHVFMPNKFVSPEGVLTLLTND